MSNETNFPPDTANYPTWRHKGIEIRVTQEAWFTATVDDDKLMDRSLDGIKVKIDETLVAAAKVKTMNLALKVVALQEREGYSHGPKPAEIVGRTVRAIHRTSGNAIYTDLPKNYTLNHVCVDLPGAREALERYVRAAKEEWDARQAVESFQFSVDRNGAHISPEKYPDVVNNLVTRYNSKVKEKTAAQIEVKQ